MAGKRIDLVRFGFSEFSEPRPLVALADFQMHARTHLSLETRVEQPQLVAGMDVSYVGKNVGVAAYAIRIGAMAPSTTKTKNRQVAYMPAMSLPRAKRDPIP